MSIQSEIDRINSNVQAALNAVADAGVSVPENANSNDLPAAVLALANEKQDKLTGAQGQVVGFDAEGRPVAQDKPSYTANDVGAIPASEKGTANGVATLGADGKVPTGQLPAMDYAPSIHASQHGSGGSDPITPGSIGAAPASHVEDTVIHLPTVTADDNGKFLCVVNGAWAAVAYPSAEDSTF